MNEMKQLEDMYAAVPPPGPQRLAGARARVLTAVAEGRAVPPKPGRRWPRWVAPLAAAAAVTAAVAIAAAISGAIRGSGSAGHRPAASTGDTIYVEIFGPPAGQDGLVPISTATNTPGKPIHIRGMSGVAITPDGRTIYVGTGGTVIPVSTATNTPGTPIDVGGGPPGGIAITP
jgi:hyaluronoglucosaminidase